MMRSVQRVAFTIGVIAVSAVAGEPLIPARIAAQSAAAPATYMTEADLMRTLTDAAKSAPAMHTAPVKNDDHYRINIVRRTTAQGAIAHPDGTEVHHIVDGGGTLVTGGTIVRSTSAPARGSAGATIAGGISRHVAKGDVILIPAGTPHWYKDLDGTITYLEVRFEIPKQ
jgi:mannose-6-phosphate isomerase-like protein (cupin superfamily)